MAPRATPKLEQLVAHTLTRLSSHTTSELADLLEDALVHERARLASHGKDADPATEAILEHARCALRSHDHASCAQVVRELLESWAGTLVNPASYGTWAALRATVPWLDKAGVAFDRAIRVSGDIRRIQALAAETPLIFAPNHTSHADTSVFAIALQLAGLPAVRYAAASELFEHPLFKPWLKRLGAYPIDRRRRSRLYKDLLVDYESMLLAGHHHALFFPQGQRSRDGSLPSSIKKGLLGSAFSAWQMRIAAGADFPDVCIVPVSITWSTVLEARTLIDDFLAHPSERRSIIEDDELSHPTRLAAFTREVWIREGAVHIHFGEPIDVFGRELARERAARLDASAKRRGYVCTGSGEVEPDTQRDRVYTQRLADALVSRWPQGQTLLPGALLADAAWQVLAQETGLHDPRRLAIATSAQTSLPAAEVRRCFDQRIHAAREGALEGRWLADVPARDDDAWALACATLGRYHAPLPLEAQTDTFSVGDARCLLYYRNQAHPLLQVLESAS